MEKFHNCTCKYNSKVIIYSHKVDIVLENESQSKNDRGGTIAYFYGFFYSLFSDKWNKTAHITIYFGVFKIRKKNAG